MPAHCRDDEEPEFTEYDDEAIALGLLPTHEPEPEIPLYHRMYASFDEEAITRKQYEWLADRRTRPITGDPIQLRDANHHWHSKQDHYEGNEWEGSYDG
jgi:hypothetical protein